jgi:hypothetical protein
MDLLRLYNLREYFGDDHLRFIGNLDPMFFRRDDKEDQFRTHFPVEEVKVRSLNDNEKSNLLKLLNEATAEFKNDDDKMFHGKIHNKLLLLNDHFRMIKFIREYEPDIQLRVTSWKNFDVEHMFLSRLQRQINRGYSIEYKFDPKLIETIESVIETDAGVFYPILLRKDLEYNEEGQHMHHCVGGYSEREDSIIVSLRHVEPRGYERVTCEYNTYNKNNVQSRYFCNAEPPEYFNSALKILHNRISTYKESIKSLEKVKIVHEFTKNTVIKLEQEMDVPWARAV